MFMKQTMQKNKKLIDAAFYLHNSGEIQPDSYLIDVDTLFQNAAVIASEAKKKNIKLYFMLKQIGRNPYIAKELMKLGYAGAVAVDFREAEMMMEAEIPIGNVGHLVQIPEAMIEKVVAYKPEVITVFSVEKAKSIDKAAKKLGIVQNIILKVYGDNDLMYSAQTAGFHIDDIKCAAEEIQRECKNVNIDGATAFPCYLYDEELKCIVPTPNLQTVLESVKILKNIGISCQMINTPSATCVYTLGLMEACGANCGEPGHGLTATTPMHEAVDMPELPCVVYVSEISHNFQGNSYCYGGGYYRRSRVSYALVGNNSKAVDLLEVIPPSDESIDYYFGISKECQIGDTVIMAFRYQIFVTRSEVILVKGIPVGKPEIIGIYDSQGRKK